MALQEERIKWVEGTPFMVDGFRFTNPRCRHYLLTHFHSDHTTGLYKSFSAGTIYTSEGTASLVIELIGVNAERVKALPMNKPVMVAGFELTLVDANHCPAAVMFIIRDPRPGGRTVLHTGDFRADKSVCKNPIVRSLRGRLDTLYLDTTYCGPRHAFPDQAEVLAEAKRLVRTELQQDPNTLFLVGTYSIGKEKVLEAVAQAAGSRCLVTSRKARILRLAGAWDDSLYTTHDAGAGGADGEGHSRVRAVFLSATKSLTALRDTLSEAQGVGAPFTSVVGIRPTGWTHQNTVREGYKVAKESARKDSLEGGDHLGDDTDGQRESPWEGEGEGLETHGGQQGSDAAFGEDSAPLAEEWRMAREPRVWGKAREYSLPYSEHSSYPQLKDFVRTVKPKKIIPTVNASSRAAVEKLLRYFLEDMDLSQDRTRLESYFRKPAVAPPRAPKSHGFAAPVAKRPRNELNLNSKRRHPPEELISVSSPTEGDKHSLVVRPTTNVMLLPDPPHGSWAPSEDPSSAGQHGPSGEVGIGPQCNEIPTLVEGVAEKICPHQGATVGSMASDDSTVDLHLVDIKAQMIILAEIERQNRLRQGPPGGGGTPPERSYGTGSGPRRRKTKTRIPPPSPSSSRHAPRVISVLDEDSPEEPSQASDPEVKRPPAKCTPSRSSRSGKTKSISHHGDNSSREERPPRAASVPKREPTPIPPADTAASARKASSSGAGSATSNPCRSTIRDFFRRSQ